MCIRRVQTIYAAAFPKVDRARPGQAGPDWRGGRGGEIALIMLQLSSDVDDKHAATRGNVQA